MSMHAYLVVSNSFATPQTVARQTPLSMGFPRQECWSGLPFPSAGDLPDPKIKPVSPAWQMNSLPLSHQGSLNRLYCCLVAKFCLTHLGPYGL